jgi:coproporphyrinogen III oxidase-like Fe-S oxidoreductase
VDELQGTTSNFAPAALDLLSGVHPPSIPPSREGSRRRPVRYTNLKHPDGYCAAVEAGQLTAFEQEELTPEIQRVERIMLGLRLNNGLNVENLNLPESKLIQLEARGWIARSPTSIRLTAEGRHFCSEVALALI